MVDHLARDLVVLQPRTDADVDGQGPQLAAGLPPHLGRPPVKHLD